MPNVNDQLRVRDMPYISNHNYSGYNKNYIDIFSSCHQYISSIVNIFVDMTLTYSKEEMVAALRSTFIGDSKTLKETADYLAEAARKPGFSIMLMEIVDDPSLPVEVKQAALIQLKNNFKMRWQSKKDPIEPSEKQLIKNALLLAVIRCHKNYKLIKLYKEIFTIIITHEYKTWMPVNAILEALSQDQDISPLIHILIAIASSFEFSITEEERDCFFAFLKSVLPVLLDLVTRRPQPEIIYLSIKFLWKAVHYEINAQLKILVCRWMSLLHAVISATNPKYETHPEDIQTRQTEQFYYFHTKKWATRIFLRFVQKHAKRVSYNKNQDNKPFADQWYANYGEPLITGLMSQFATPTTRKVRYFQLKCLQPLITERPETVKQYGEIFQYDFLLRFMRLQPQDEQLADRQPIQFLARQDEPSTNFTNLKRVATDVWISFAQLGCKQQKKGQNYEPGVFFYQNMNYLQSKLQDSNPVEKELAMYLICQLRIPITRCKPVKQMLPTLISKYIIPEFKNEIMFLRARAVDIFSEYGSMQLDIEVVKQAVEGIYICLTKDTHPLVRIKAASAFNCILKHKTAKDLVRPLLKDILTIYLQLLEQYDLQNIINSLESIVEDFSTEIAPFAYELVRHLGKLFFKLFNKDIQKSNQEQYDGEAELAAAGCLKTITRIIESPIPQQTINQLQSEVIMLLEFIFGQEGIDYTEDALILLNSYLYKAKKITGHLWFYYQVVVYNMSGIPKQMWGVLDKLPLQQKQKNIMKNIKNGENYEFLEQSMPVIRNYIQKSSLLGHEPQQEAFKKNTVSLLFYMINEIYKKGPNEYSGEIDATCCTALIIYLLQNYQKVLPQPIYAHIWQISKVNIIKLKSKMIKILTSQLLGLLIWNSPTQVLTLAHRDKLLPTLFKQLTIYDTKYEMEHERARVILGLNTLISLPQKPNQIMSFIPDVFKTILRLVRKNAEERLQDQSPTKTPKLPTYNDGFDDEDNADMEEYNLQSDEQDFWQQQYDDNYDSALENIDEIAQFKKTIQTIATEQPTFYQQLIKTVAAEDLIAIEQTIKKVLPQQQTTAKTS